MDYKARFYSPYINRFLQPDSLIPNPSNPQAWNRYSYVMNRPVNFNDPTGHEYSPPCPFCNITLWDYSKYSSTTVRALDRSILLAAGCFLLNCNIDRDSHKILGPTFDQYVATGVHSTDKVLDEWIQNAPLLISEVNKQIDDLNLIGSWKGEFLSLIQNLRR